MVALRYTPKDSCIPAIPFLISVVLYQPSFPLIRISNSSQHSNPLLCLLTQRHEEPKWLDDSHNFQFNGIIVSSGRSIPLYGPETTRPTNHKVTERGRKNFAGGSLVIVSSELLLFPPLDSWTHEFLLWKKHHHILYAN